MAAAQRLINRLKRAGHYPYSDLDRKPVAYANERTDTCHTDTELRCMNMIGLLIDAGVFIFLLQTINRDEIGFGTALLLALGASMERGHWPTA